MGGELKEQSRNFSTAANTFGKALKAACNIEAISTGLCQRSFIVSCDV
jgi:hypothetical protein